MGDSELHSFCMGMREQVIEKCLRLSHGVQRQGSSSGSFVLSPSLSLGVCKPLLWSLRVKPRRLEGWFHFDRFKYYPSCLTGPKEPEL